MPIVSNIAWNLMPNHFHFMLHTDARCSSKTKQGGIFIDPLTNGFRKLLSGYARIFTNEYGKSGSLFRQKTKAKSLSEIDLTSDSSYSHQDYFRTCFHYIHQNPLVAKLVSRLEDWEYSSFKDYAGLRNGTLCQMELATIHCGYQPATFVKESYDLVEKKLIMIFR